MSLGLSALHLGSGVCSHEVAPRCGTSALAQAGMTRRSAKAAPCADRRLVMAGWLRRGDDGSYDHGTDETPDPLRAICAAIIARYACVYRHDRTTATTYINDDAVVVCVLENILSAHEEPLIAEGQATRSPGASQFKATATMNSRQPSNAYAAAG